MDVALYELEQMRVTQKVKSLNIAQKQKQIKKVDNYQQAFSIKDLK